MKIEEFTNTTIPFEDCVLKSHPTGSRYICNPAPMDTDNDTVFLVNGYHDYFTILEKDGWERGGSSDGDGDFTSFRKGVENYIITENPDFYLSFVMATVGAKALNLLKKEDRITLFQALKQTNMDGRDDPVEAINNIRIDGRLFKVAMVV